MCKKTSKILLILVAVVLISVATLYIAIGAFGSVSLLSGACAGGFKNDLIEKNKESIIASTEFSIDDTQLSQISQNIDWDGRTVEAEFYNPAGEKFVLTGELKWYWNGTFEWTVEKI